MVSEFLIFNKRDEEEVACKKCQCKDMKKLLSLFVVTTAAPTVRHADDDCWYQDVKEKVKDANYEDYKKQNRAAVKKELVEQFGVDHKRIEAQEERIEAEEKSERDSMEQDLSDTGL